MGGRRESLEEERRWVRREEVSREDEGGVAGE